MDAQVLATLEAVNDEEDEARRQDLRDQSNAALSSHFAAQQNFADLTELAFELLNITWSDVMTNDIVQQLIEVKTVGLGDPDYVEEDLRGMRAYWQGKGGEIFSDIIRYEQNQMPREEIVAAIDMHADEILTNFWGAIGKLEAQCREKVRQAPTTRL